MNLGFQQPSSLHMGEHPSLQDKAKERQAESRENKDRDLKAILLDQSLRLDSLSSSFNLVNYLSSLLCCRSQYFLFCLNSLS